MCICGRENPNNLKINKNHFLTLFSFFVVIIIILKQIGHYLVYLFSVVETTNTLK